MPEIKVKKMYENAVIPSYAKDGDAAMDLTANSVNFEEDLVVYGTGLAMEIPKGFCGLIFPRSSVSKMNLSLANCVGVIDSGYRGEIILKYRSTDFVDDQKYYKVGERIGQIMLIPVWQISFIEVDELSSTERGSGGFGSTGK